jgi:glycerol-1-phosphate dehydrogenase [NAD(P)+]
MAGDIDACLRRHGLPRTPAELGLGEDAFTAAVLHAPATRPDRYTVLEHLALGEQEVATRVREFAAAFA